MYNFRINYVTGNLSDGERQCDLIARDVADASSRMRCGTVEGCEGFAKITSIKTLNREPSELRTACCRAFDTFWDDVHVCRACHKAFPEMVEVLPELAPLDWKKIHSITDHISLRLHGDLMWVLDTLRDPIHAAEIGEEDVRFAILSLDNHFADERASEADVIMLTEIKRALNRWLEDRGFPML